VRNVYVITTSRAEYGLLRPLIRLLRTSDEFEVQIVVSGAHLSIEFGETWRDIVADGFDIAEKVDIVLASDNSVATAKSAALAISGVAPVLARLRTEALVILGDRYEMAAVAIAASLLRIPIVHIHGGETTLGANDEAFRHAITKMSHLHFTSTDIYRRRVIQLGESPRLVFNVGALGLDSIQESELMSREEMATILGLDESAPYVVVTYHPETLASHDSAEQANLIVETLLDVPGLQLVCTKANADVGGRAINARLSHYGLRYPDRVRVFAALGQMKYLSAVKHSAGVVGNTSSGIIEAPSLGVGSLDVGDRQAGRLRAKSVLHADWSPESISLALRQLLDPEWVRHLGEVHNPYGDGHAATRMVSILSRCTWPLSLVKPFYDVAFSVE
jgi:UDP-hydrolysing UDP-N-acetyl-D-glucosamine 2-epimerase